MSSSRTLLTDLRGAARVAVDATESIAGVVETVHRTVQLRRGPFGPPAEGRTRGITGLVYRNVRRGIRLTGWSIDAGLGLLAARLADNQPAAVADAWVAAVNGICGDYLEQSGNPLAIDMGLHYRGNLLDHCDLATTLAQSDSNRGLSKLVVLAHGLCMNDRQWLRQGHDHGAALATDLGYVPLYLRYNSGLAISNNGRKFANMLEALIRNWPTPLEELVIVGHSMGGLVARSACHYGQKADHAWTRQLGKLVFLGTPHHGAPLERGGHVLDRLLHTSPYLVPFTRLSMARSAGITDLHDGNITSGEAVIPLPAAVNCHAAAATLISSRHGLAESLVGDGLVPLDSALARPRKNAPPLDIPESRQWVGYGMGHLDLLHHRRVYARLRSWVQSVRLR